MSDDRPKIDFGPCLECQRLRAKVSRAESQLGRDQRDIDNCRDVIRALLDMVGEHKLNSHYLQDGTPMVLASRRALGLAL